MSCPYKQTDLMRQCDYCEVLDAKVDRVLVCDVDYDYCPDYFKSKLKMVANKNSEAVTQC